jgi:crossover junction endodeoxyribonuclease RuvC
MSCRVLGIDPGSRATGWALVIAEGNRYHIESAGVVRPAGSNRPQRLGDLQRRLESIVKDLAPDCAAVESSFSGINPKSGLALAESSPAQVKSAIVGHGRAEKRQIKYMVVRLLNLDDSPQADTADAMAVALTHIHLGAWKNPR